MKTLAKTSILLASTLSLAAAATGQQNFTLRSPDSRIEVRIHASHRLAYDVYFKGTPLLENSELSINIDHKTLGVNSSVVSTKERSQDQILEPVVRQKFAKIRDNFHELHLQLQDGLGITFRAYNEGAAYRLETLLPAEQVHVYDEQAVSALPVITPSSIPVKTVSFRTMSESICRKP